MTRLIYSVYKVTNQVNGKIYIGWTKRTIEARWKAHCDVARKRRKRLHHAMAKHGKENFTIECIYQSLDKKESLDRETYFIKLYNSIDRHIGYNSTFGGECTVFTNEIRKKMSESQKTDRNPFIKGLSRKSIEKRVRNNSGEKHCLYGKKLPDEWRSKIKDSMQKNLKDPEYLKKRQETARTMLNKFYQDKEAVKRRDEKAVKTKRSKNPIYKPEVIDLISAMKEEGYTHKYIGEAVGVLIGRDLNKGMIGSFVAIARRNGLLEAA